MKFLKIMPYALLISAVVPAISNAAVLITLSNQEVVVPVNAELGTIFELPSAVKTLTPAKYFTITDMGGVVNPNGGALQDVRTFLVKPSKITHPESITFVLTGGKSIAVRLVATSGAEKFYEVHLENKKVPAPQKFLASEMSMLRAMLVDENGGYVRDIVDTKVSTPKIEDLEFTLKRVYSAADYTGYVFRVRNKGKMEAIITPGSIAIGKPNRAVLAQSEKEKIESCPFLRTTPGCVTTVRFVVRGPKIPEAILGVVPNVQPPYVKPSAKIDGGPL